MNAPGAVRMDASPITIVTASARTAHAAEPTPAAEVFEALSREGFRSMDTAERVRALPRKSWTIVAAGLLAWAVIAIPAWLIFG